jgi:hypothetical protein
MKRAGGKLGLGVVAALVLAAWPASATARPATAVELRDCLLVVDAFPVAPEQVQPRYVPADYTLTPSVPTAHTVTRSGSPDAATVAFWSLDCDGATIRGGEFGQTQLTLVGVEVDNGDTKSLGGFWPQYWAHYLTSAHTDNGALVGLLAAAGLPAHEVSDMRFEVTPLAVGISHTSVHVGWLESPFELSVTPPIPHNVVTHDHDNLFWRGDWGPDTGRLELVIPEARDHFCSGGPECGSAATEGGEIADLLGARFRGDASFAADHDRIAHVELRLLPRGR